MAGSLDAGLQLAAFDLCNDVGRTYTVQGNSAQTYDPTTGISRSIATASMTVLGSPPLDYDISMIDEKNVQRGDVRVIVPFKQSDTKTLDSIDFASFRRDRPGQTFDIDGDTLTAVTVKPLHSGAQIAAFEFQLRR